MSNTNYPYNLLSEIYLEPIDENHDLMVRGCYLDIKALPKMLEKLPEKMRECIRMLYEEGLSEVETAEKAGLKLRDIRSMKKYLDNTHIPLLCDADYGKIANEPWEDLMIQFYNADSFLCFSEGTGDNLLPEDIKAGYVDYINWTAYKVVIDGEPEFREVDGGMVLTKEHVRDLSPMDIVSMLGREAKIENPWNFSIIVSD